MIWRGDETSGDVKMGLSPGIAEHGISAFGLDHEYLSEPDSDLA